MAGCGETIAGCGWWDQNFGCSWVVIGGGIEVMADHGWSWRVAAKL